MSELVQIKYINTHQRKHSVENPEIENTRRPQWLKVKLPTGENYAFLKNLVSRKKLNTVCEDARCPNMAECWSRKTATVMILGEVCTRSCGFCSVKLGKPDAKDYDEPRRVAESVKELGLKHAVITSVNRDDEKLGGADIFAMTINKIREIVPQCKVEVLIPDFRGVWEALDIVIEAKPDILNHNIETVPRLYHFVRPQANYRRTLELLSRSKQSGLATKSGFMVGLGETEDEVFELMQDLRKVNCDIITIGQYLRPTKNHLPVQRYVHPEMFRQYKVRGLEMGFNHVESGPLVRSSYHADEQAV
ncbi:MAG: lipoyl synthase [Chlorobi bacterium]|nr:lipoyl synthase [Chlorobiota bacterium]MCI0715324.1 lipoyl synthase [Chlorobiota bacterium]